MTGIWHHKAGPIPRMVRCACARQLAILVAERAAIVAAVTMAVRAAGLAAGVYRANGHWYLWLASITLLLFLVVIFEVRPRLFSSYEMAQRLDARAGFHDSLSTAWFLLTSQTATAELNAAAQISRANALVNDIRLDKLFPLPAKKLLTTTAIAALLACAGWMIPRGFSFGRSEISSAQSGHKLQKKRGIREFDAQSRTGNGDSTRAQEEKRGQDQNAENGPTSNSASTELGGTQDDRSQKNGTLWAPEAGTSGISNSGKYDSEKNAAGAESRAANDYQNSGSTRDTAMPGVSDRLSTSSAASTSGNEGDRSRRAGASAGSLLSRLLAEFEHFMKRGGDRKLSSSGKQGMQTQNQPGGMAKSDAAQYQGLSSSSIPSDQQKPNSATPGSNASSLSAQQSPQGNPNDGAGNGDTNPANPMDTLKGFDPPHSVVESISANPDGATGHATVPASHNAKSNPLANPSGYSGQAEEAGDLPRDEVPAGYQPSIEAYLEHTHDPHGHSNSK